MSDAPGFDQIVARYGPSLARLAWAYVDDAADHADLQQDVLVAIWRALPAFRGDASVRTFVFRIAHNRGITFAARQRRRPSVPLPDSVPDERSDATAALDARERAERLRLAIRRLPPPQRQAISACLEGLSLAEIAELQATTTNNVSVRLTRAREALRAWLVEDR
jgi:RNA polymerase sigma-70 factor (ECF subfamily)